MRPLSKKCVDMAVKCNLAQDTVLDTDLFEDKIHFDGCCIQEGIDFINEQWSEIEKCVKGDCNKETLEKILCAFGKILHAIQDFYSHTNWVENNREIWDGENVEGIISGTFGLDRGCCPKGKDVPTHGELNKDEPSRKYYPKAIRMGYKHSKKLYNKLKTTIPWLEECCSTS